MRAFVVTLSGFLASIWLATRMYPGGTFFARHGEGFDFWGNFWCDLLHERAFDGADNTASMWLARIAFWLFAAALLCFWPRAAELSDNASVRRWCVALGASSAATLLGVTAFSSADEPVVHAFLVIGSALLGVIAASVLALSMFATTDRATRLLTLLMLLSALSNLVQYARQGLGLTRHAHWLGGAQKITTVLLLAFMLRCAWLWTVRIKPRAPRSAPATEA